MQTKEELAKLYSTFTDRQLLDIINDKDQYTENALKTAHEEMQKRNIGAEHVRDYIEDKIIEAKISERTASIELSFFEKLLFFIIWFIPFMGTATRMNFAEDGMTTKLKQSKIFSTTGFLTFMLTGFLEVIFKHSNLESIFIWLLFFVPTFFLEKKLRQITSN